MLYLMAYLGAWLGGIDIVNIRTSLRNAGRKLLRIGWPVRSSAFRWRPGLCAQFAVVAIIPVVPQPGYQVARGSAARLRPLAREKRNGAMAA